MKKTIIKVEYERGSPPDIEINGKQLSNVAERVVFYTIVGLLVVGAVWATVNVVFPLVWFLLTLLLSIIGLGFLVIALIVVLAIVIGLFRWRSGKRRNNDFWDDS